MAKIESDKPLPKHTRLKYEECYAKVILEDLFPDEYKELRIEDKPDLINEATSVGIEVTSAISENHREAINLWAGMPYASPEKQEQNKERMQKLGVEYQGGIQGWPSEECPFEEIINAFDKKIEKLNSG